MSDTAQRPVSHCVYFKLKDRSTEAVEALVAECKEKLDGHPGVLAFNVGVVGTGFDRPVNDNDWDVALYLLFEDRAAHDTYQMSERHQSYIATNKDSWAEVRVFDAEVV
ncbi:Dabb family protein [Aeoliella sp. ICT_H6.2]|uniref:Dabb family protein n=1 Tax=Aeoliella straminimaris TaxID=2954799 RepID=A0A9X2F7D3_9BACT|nr:Dabb family protein [Aeoliella straminimaris]MCO6043712.1 Dabb family protein [Aeoliella straminimaris]